MSRALELARSLVACETVNPPGGEGRACDLLEPVLSAAGLKVTRHPLAEGRHSLIARLDGSDPSAAPLCLTGHLDTVGVGAQPWRYDPFEARIVADLLYGRGACDMKGGVAALVAAVERLATVGQPQASVELVLCAGEETGCQGARSLVGSLATAGALVVAEPTSNRALTAHKGALWLEATTTGKSAHGSTPHVGENAIYAMAPALSKLRDWRFDTPEHPLLGRPTLNVGTIAGGQGVNSVADRCTAAIDIRTTPELSHSEAIDRLADALGEGVDLETLIDLPAVASDPHDGWIAEVLETVESVTGSAQGPAAARYFTDASVLTPAYGNPPTLICGPGNPEQAHQVDEYCSVTEIELAAELYLEIARRFCGL